MSEHGFATLIEQLSEPAPSQPESVPIAAEQGNIRRSTSRDPRRGAIAAVQELSREFDPREPKPDATTLSAPNVNARAIADGQPGLADTQSDLQRTMGSVSLRRWERNALKRYYTLVPTPRGATRLLNTYRLVRAGITAAEWDDFRGDENESGDFRLAMLLLALAAGYPAVAREWFGILRSKDPATPLASKPLDGRNLAAWVEFKNLCDKVLAGSNANRTNGFIGKWLERVEMFTF